jgi:hypothetical protein
MMTRRGWLGDPADKFGFVAEVNIEPNIKAKLRRMPDAERQQYIDDYIDEFRRTFIKELAA